MYKYIVLGSGKQGTAIAYDLARFGSSSSIVLADSNVNVAKQSSDRVNSLLEEELTTYLELDIYDKEAVFKALDVADVMISAVPYFHNLYLTDIAIQSGTSMIDLGGHTDNVRKQLSKHDQALEKNITILPDCGMGPGMNVTLGLLAMEQLDSPKHLRVWDGGLPLNPNPPWNYSLFFNINGLTNEYDGEAYFLKDSKIDRVPCFEGLEKLKFDSLGTLEAAVTSGGLSTMPWTYEGKLITLENKTLRYPGHWDKMIAYRQLGLFEEKEIQFKNQNFSPRSFYHHLLEPQLAKNDSEDICIMRTEAQGTKDGVDKVVVVESIEKYDDKTKFNAMEKWTGWHASILAIEAAKGALPRGAVSIENAMSGQDFLKEAEKRNFKISIKIS
jgi:lysine 6-dehydrogenase